MFRVGWLQVALDELTTLWTQGNATQRQAITRASDTIDQRLGSDPGDLAWSAAVSGDRLAQANLLRDILGNPFRRVAAAPSCLMWNEGTVVKLSETIYDHRAFDRLPILADALEEAGCHDVDILNHCRQPGPHVPACWVVDLVLGKK